MIYIFKITFHLIILLSHSYKCKIYTHIWIFRYFCLAIIIRPFKTAFLKHFMSYECMNHGSIKSYVICMNILNARTLEVLAATSIATIKQLQLEKWLRCKIICKMIRNCVVFTQEWIICLLQITIKFLFKRK